MPGYDLHFRLMRHWAKKERLRELGVDPNTAVNQARRASAGIWSLKGEYLSWLRATRKFEFEFLVQVAELENAVLNEGTPVSEGKATMVQRLRDALGEVGMHVTATAGTWNSLEERIDAHLVALGDDVADEAARKPAP